MVQFPSRPKGRLASENSSVFQSNAGESPFQSVTANRTSTIERKREPQIQDADLPRRRALTTGINLSATGREFSTFLVTIP